MNARRTILVLALATVAGAVLAACGEGTLPKATSTAGQGAGTADGSGKAEITDRSSSGGSSVAVGVAGSFDAGRPPAGLTVTGRAQATVDADDAFVVFTANAQVSGPGGPAPLTERAQDDVRAALAAIGVAKEDVSFESDFRFGPFPTISVRTDVKTVKERADAILDAIGDVVGQPQQQGVRFGVKDCEAKMAPLRRDAFKQAEEKAKSLASASELTVGRPVALSESRQPSPYGPPVDDPCQPLTGVGVKGGGPVQTADSPAEVTLTLDLVVTFALGAETAGAGLSATGTGTVTAVADEAYVVVFIENFGPTGPKPIEARDRVAVFASLKALGIEEADIEFVSSPFGGPSLVSVEIDVTDLERRADDIADAIEEILGRSNNRGLRFSHSACEELKGEAQKLAVTQAKKQASALAESTGVKLGGIGSISESLVANIYGPPQTDPCAEDADSQALSGYGYGLLLPFDAKPEVKVPATVVVTYRIE